MTTNPSPRLFACSAAAALIVTFATGPWALAQQSDTASAANTDQLEDVVITARRVEESQQKVPVTVTALSQKDLTQQIVLGVQDLQTSTPGLFVAPNAAQGDAPLFAIRGARQDNGTSPTVAVYIDDVPVFSTYAIANMVYDMQSISTLYGPQGTLFGANSTGGAIIFRPNKPSDTFEGYAQVGFGDYDRKEFQAMVNIPVNEMLQFRLGGEIVRREGFETNLTPNTPSNERMDDDYHDSLRGSMRLRLSDTLLNDTLVTYYHIQDQPIELVNVAYRTFDYPTFLGISVPVSYSAAGIKPVGPWNVETNSLPTWNKATIYTVANTTTWDVTPNWSLKSVIGYENDAISEAQNAGDVPVYIPSNPLTISNVQQWTLEPSSTITWDDGRWNNKTGIFFSHIDASNDQSVSFRGVGLPFDFTGLPASEETLVDSFYPLQVNEIVDNVFKSEALYDQASVKLSPELTFTAGARYTFDQGSHVESDRLAFPSTPGGLGPYGDLHYGPCETSLLSTYQNFNAAACTGTRSQDTNAPSFTLTLEDQFAERKMLYASLRGGYLEGGFNVAVAAEQGQIFQPERVTSFEGGLKADWDAAGRPLRTNVAIFYGTYRGQQRVQYGRSQTTGETYAAVANASSTEFYGADVELVYAVTHYLDLEASWEYLIAQYLNYNAALNVPGINAAYDLTGVQEAEAPKDVFTVAATFKWPVPEKLGAVSTTLSYFYRSQSLAGDGPSVGGSCAGNTATNPVTTCTAPGSFIPNLAENYTAYDILPAFGMANLTTEWKGIAGSHVDAQLWVKNFTNKYYYTYAQNQLLPSGYAQVQPGDPRTFGVRLRYNF